MSAVHEALMRRLFDEVINGGNWTVMDMVYAPYCVDRNARRRPTTGLASLRSALEELRAAIPDLQVTLEEIRSEGETVVTREIWCGTHVITGKWVSGSVSHIFTVQEGRIVEEWSGGWEWFEQACG